MAQVSFSQMIHADQIGEGIGTGLGKEGILKTENHEFTVLFFSDSEAVTEAVAKFLQEANQQGRPLEKLLDYQFAPLTQEIVELGCEIEWLHNQLAKQEVSTEGDALIRFFDQPHSKEQPQIHEKNTNLRSTEKPAGKAQLQATGGRSDVVYSSLFSLARSFHATLAENKNKKGPEKAHNQRSEGREEVHASQAQSVQQSKKENPIVQEGRYDREGNGKQEQGKKQDEDQEGHASHQDQKQKQEKHREKKSKVISIESVQAARSQPRQAGRNLNTATSDPAQGGKHQEPTPSVDNIYIRFMALMARILGQAEYEAHQLYLRIKDRTDAIDVLTLLISKLNSEKGAIDWSNNEEMKKLVEKARALGVDIPEGKYKWSEEEKKLLKENVQMRKDSMEKMTQLERTDMQRYLQEASQCHQARSNTLKLLKEVTDTIIHNMRPS
jgi:hypothetical protein